MSISAALIVRNCEDTLPACLESIRPHVDAIVIVDTGSTDGTRAIAEKYATKFEVFTECNRNPLTGQLEDRIWDFSAARNKSFELVDTEWVWWQDSDDQVYGAENLRPAAASAPPGPFAYLAPYEYSYSDAAMTMPNCIHWRERLIRNPHDMVWQTPCHEVCMPRSGVIQHDHLPTVVLKHRAQVAKNPREPGRNRRILEAYLRRVGESDIRAMYYMGVEYARGGAFGLARKTLRRYVEISGWSDERCLAQLELARIALQEGDCTEALRWANEALDTKSWPDPYWLKVKAFCRMADEGAQADREYNMRRAIGWAERGRPLEDAQTVLFYNPTERYDTERFVARILGMGGDIDGAAEACRRGLQGMPGDPDLMEQLRGYETVRIGREMDTLLSRLVHLGRIDERVGEAVNALVTGQIQLEPAPANDVQVPGPYARIGTGAAVDMAALPPVPEGKLDIVIVTGPAFEDWTPETIEKTGIGGSETMAWEMARGLARLGHRVRHYGWCKPEQEGQYEGVHWFDSARYRDIECDALVVSRYADLVRCVGGTNAKARLLWLHDVHAGAALTPAHALRYDRVLCLSQWHKEFVCGVYPYLDPERVVVTRNGIDLDMFANPEERNQTRNPHRAVYSSSPDRGLQTALELWPLVRAEVPDAELHVFYGFDNLRRGRPSDVALADKLEATAKATAGVVLHGRIAPRQLAREFLNSGVWFYPTWFSETSCITAMQAQAAGLYCVTSPIAALNETVGHFGEIASGAPEPVDIQSSFELHSPTPEYVGRVVALVVDCMSGKEPETRAANAGRAAENFSLVTLASDWSAMLSALVADPPMPRFYVEPAMAAVAREIDEAAA